MASVLAYVKPGMVYRASHHQSTRALCRSYTACTGSAVRCDGTAQLRRQQASRHYPCIPTAALHGPVYTQHHTIGLSWSTARKVLTCCLGGLWGAGGHLWLDYFKTRWSIWLTSDAVWFRISGSLSTIMRPLHHDQLNLWVCVCIVLLSHWFTTVSIRSCVNTYPCTGAVIGFETGAVIRFEIHWTKRIHTPWCYERINTWTDKAVVLQLQESTRRININLNSTTYQSRQWVVTILIFMNILRVR